MIKDRFQIYPHYRDVVQSKNGMVLIDTCHTFDGLLETMVFRCNEDGRIVRNEDWIELDRLLYNNVDDMKNGHQRMIGKWSEWD